MRRLAALLVLAWSGPLGAQQLLALSWDNDLLTGSDQGYTNGVRLSWFHDMGSPPKWLPGLDARSRNGLAVSLRQIMITPDDLERETPDFNDIPYVGYFSADISWYRWRHDSLTGYGVSLGVVGEDSGAASSQRSVHRLTGSTFPRGWENQLGNDTVGGVRLIHARRFIGRTYEDEYQREWVAVGGVRAHSFISNVELGLFWRMGHNLPGNFLPEYTGLASDIGLPGLLEGNGSGWSVYAGTVLEAVPYSYIQENAGPYDFQQNFLIGHLTLGAGLHSEGFHAALTLRATTAQEKTNKTPLTFGSLSFVWQL